LCFHVGSDEVFKRIAVEVRLVPAVLGGPLLLRAPDVGDGIGASVVPRDGGGAPVALAVVERGRVVALQKGPGRVEFHVRVGHGLREDQVATALLADFRFPFRRIKVIVEIGVSPHGALGDEDAWPALGKLHLADKGGRAAVVGDAVVEAVRP
jgi:hypothetical protein